MSLAIVTSRSFLLCEAVNNISIDSEFQEYPMSQQFIRNYMIHIDFVPLSRGNGANNQSQRGDERNVLTIKVIGEQTALKLFKELVGQIREQCPDQAYLDKMVENILSGKIGDIVDDTNPVEVRSTRKKKRRSKKVSRRAGGSKRRTR